MSHIITISREFGSGGREVGLRLADALHIPFYDKEIIFLAAEQGNLSPAILEEYEETVSHPAFFNPRPGLFTIYQQSLTDKIYLEQRRVIQNLAEKGPCVIVGRCADAILNGKSVNVFIHADLSVRVERKLSLDIGVPKEEMERHIQSVDKKRKEYCRHYTDRIWGAAQNYHLCVSTSELSTEAAAEVILCCLKHL